ncbi:hypothetical protein A3747_15380 [Sulfitobacter sp. HI0076]|nr:hypothetical protein A3722_09335 [Sulfitobacter sp. HI0027]KZZ02500.1 hypothetical protein A3747_15380 [Sulfitobacter sp. HI0076]
MLRILLPLLVWLVSFSAIYGLQGLGCALGWAKVAWLGLPLFRWALLIAWLAAIVLQLLLLLTVGKWSFGPTTDFYRKVNLATALSGLTATVWTSFPIVVSSTCG